MAMSYLDGPRPRVFGHRGACGEAPENTLPSFAAAIAAGADRLELDVHRTADGEIVVFHDDTLDRTTDGRGPIARLTGAELSRLDAGYRFGEDGAYPMRGAGVRVPRLAEVLEAFPEVPLNIEIKPDDPRAVAGTLAVLDRFGARARALLAAEDASRMARIREAAPDVLTSFCSQEVAEFLASSGKPGYAPPPAFALQVPPSFWGVPVVTAESVARAHALGLEVHVWTINEVAEMERLLALGVDALMSDFPGRVVELLRRRGLRAG
jgi:glycerophosphoryl diester phosphodiesterase